MSKSNHFSDRLREPLNETTRKVRRNLMASSVLGVVFTKVGLVPTKLSAFGVEFSSSNQEALMLLLACAIAYFFISFSVYVYSELTAWQIDLASKEIEEFKELSNNNEHPIFGGVKGDKFRDYLKSVHSKSRPTFYIRLIVELALPILFAIYSGYSLLINELPQERTIKAVVQEPANKPFKQDK